MGQVSLDTSSWYPGIQVQGQTWIYAQFLVPQPGPPATSVPGQQSSLVHKGWRQRILLACWVVLCSLSGPGVRRSRVHLPPPKQWSSSLNFTWKAIPTLQVNLEQVPLSPS